MVCRSHGGHGPDGDIPRICLGVDLHEDERFSGELEVLREGRRWGGDIEAGRWALHRHVLLGVGGFDAGFLLEVLCVC